MSKVTPLNIPHHTGIRVPLGDSVTGATRVVRIPVAHRTLTTAQLSGLARALRRHCNGGAIRVSSPDEIEIAVAWPQADALAADVEQLYFVAQRGSAPPSPAIHNLPIPLHVPRGELNSRQLLALAALMHIEGVDTVTVESTTSLQINGVPATRQPSVLLGLSEFGFTVH